MPAIMDFFKVIIIRLGTREKLLVRPRVDTVPLPV